MTILRRPTAASRVLDLTKELAEEFDNVPLPAVSRAVQTATETVDLRTTDVASTLAAIEDRARGELAGQRAAS